MKEDCNGVKVWRANTAIRKAMGVKGTVPIYVSEQDLNNLAAKHPEDYLSMLEGWMRFLTNQTFYSMGERMLIVCHKAVDGDIKAATFECAIEDGALRLLNVEPEIRQGVKWSSVKTDGRR